MARGNTAASVSTTIGAATATLFVVGAILAWPIVSGCSGSAGGFGACLRDMLAERGILAPEDYSTERPGAPDVPAPLPVPPRPPSGWLEARAAEIAPNAIAPIELVGSPAGELSGEGMSVLGVAPRVSLAPTPKLDATVDAQRKPPVGSVRLRETFGGLEAVGVEGDEDAPVARVALVGPVGAITAQILAPAAAGEPAARLVPPVEAGRLSVEVPTDRGSSMTPLVLEPLPAEPAFPTIPMEAPAEMELTAEIIPMPVAPPSSPVVEAEVPAFIFNPAYPNVLMLPAPATGENSSIRTLTLD